MRKKFPVFCKFPLLRSQRPGSVPVSASNTLFPSVIPQIYNRQGIGIASTRRPCFYMNQYHRVATEYGGYVEILRGRKGSSLPASQPWTHPWLRNPASFVQQVFCISPGIREAVVWPAKQVRSVNAWYSPCCRCADCQCTRRPSCRSPSGVDGSTRFQR